MTSSKIALQRKIEQELSLLEAPDISQLAQDCPERAWLKGAACMAEKIARLLEEEGEDSACLLKRTVLGPLRVER